MWIIYLCHIQQMHGKVIYHPVRVYVYAIFHITNKRPTRNVKSCICFIEHRVTPLDLERDGKHANTTHLNSGDSSPISSKSPLPSYSIVPSAASFALFNRANSSMEVMHSTILHTERR